MSEIIVSDSLSGTISSETALSGSLSSPKEYTIYSGPYEVIPKAFESQTLDTHNKVMEYDILVVEVPYYETSNDANGTTAYIAKEVE